MKPLFTFFFAFALLSGQIVFAQYNRNNNKKTNVHNSNFQRICAGHFTGVTFEIRNGTLWGWGVNSFNIGDSTINIASTPVQIGTDNNWVSVAPGHMHSLGIKSNGTLWAWGWNDHGALGTGNTITSKVPVQVGTDNKWVKVIANNDCSFGLKSDGTIWAWGSNGFGQLGVPIHNNKLSPVQIGTDSDWVSLTAGGHCLALKSNGSLWGWGANGYAQLGLGNLNTSTKYWPVRIGADKDWVAIAAGGGHSIALKSNGTIWGWGYDGYGQIGMGPSVIAIDIPTQIGTDNKWISIDAGGDHSFALKSDGTLWAGGYGFNGELGNGISGTQEFPIKIGTENNWVAVSAGFVQGYGLKSDGTLWGWGANSYGQLGYGDTIDHFSPVLIGTDLNQWLTLSAGGSSSMGLKSNGTAWGWGNNNFGQLGTGDTLDYFLTARSDTGGKWVSLVTSGHHTLGIRSDGSIWAWGRNDYGQLGDSSTQNRTMPVRVGNSNHWVSIAAGEYHSIALKSDGTIWVWGRNNLGQHGNGTSKNSIVPIRLGTESTWISISSSSNHCLALKCDGTMWAWGRNDSGQIGDGTLNNSFIPNQVGTATNWTSLAAGYAHSLALKADGTLWGWGSNNFGQLGDGSIGQKTSPVQIGIDKNWIKITAGGHHSAGLKADGTLRTWGRNSTGQLGDASKTDKNIPVNPSGDSNWVTVACGFSHSLALKTDRRLFCTTGSNSDGQLADTTPIGRNNFVCNCTSHTPPLVSLNKRTCSGKSILLTASGGGILSWYDTDSGGTWLGGGTKFITPVLTATRAFYVQDSMCSAGIRKEVIVTVDSFPVVKAIATKTKICTGESVTLNGAGANFYSWSSGVSNGIGFKPVATKKYIVTGTALNGCKNTDSVIITVNLPPLVTAHASINPVCAGSLVALKGAGASTYVWTGGIIDTVPFEATVSKTYIVTGTDSNNCTDTALISLIVDPLPLTSTTVSGSAISVAQSGAVYQWLDCNNGYAAIPAAVNQMFTAISTGNYAVKVTQNGCSDTSACVSIIISGIENNEKSNDWIKVYPNPAFTAFTIESNKQGNYILFNSLGQQLGRFELNQQNNYTVHFESLESGVYYIEGTYGELVKREKLIITR